MLASLLLATHFLYQPQTPLTNDDLIELAQRGVTVQRPVAGGRYILVAEEGSVPADAQPLRAEQKIYPAAIREAASPAAFAHLDVVFHHDVSWERARELITFHGGAADDPLQLALDSLHRVRARIPSSNLYALASADEVLVVDAARALRPASDNRSAAALASVTSVQGPVYGLSGAGVVLSFFELAAADRTHPEFGGRLVTRFGGGTASDVEHATHVAGTIIASGIDPSAKGMAPAATLQEFSACGSCDWLRDKERSLSPLNVSADNNSWGFILGWCRPPNCPSITWTGNDDLYGGYFYLNAGIDRVARTNGVLMMHSSGNEADNNGPPGPDFAHKHVDDNGDPLPSTFCYSANGSGTDCVAPCSSGAQFCETTRHPINAPFGSVGVTASSKNVLTVGAIDTLKGIGSFSSRGPTRDGRIKPEVVAQGVGVVSTLPSNRYGPKNGTSMSTPVVTGIAALLTEQWRRTFGSSPLPIALKTLLIAGTEDLGLPGPDYTYGYGAVNAQASVDAIRADEARGRRIRIGNLSNGQTHEFTINLSAPQTLRVVLGWADPEVILLGDELAANTLVNDLDVRVVGPGGTSLPYVLNPAQVIQPATTGVNRVDNTEMIEVRGASAGTYRIQVVATRIAAASPQQYTLVTNASMDVPPIPPRRRAAR